MSLTYDEIIREASVLARPYSQNHLNYSKWRSYNARATEVPEQFLTIHEIEDKTYALIYRPALACFEAFEFESIIKRTFVKRNEKLFQEITALWKLVNPFHLPGISKNVYQKLFEFIHFSVLNTNASIEESELVSKIDLNLDFAEGVVMNFVQYIDSIFECVDAFTKSTLVNEYCRVVKRLATEVKRSIWLKNVDLHSKLNCEGLKPVFPSWANLAQKSLETVTSRVMLTPRITDTKPNSVKKERNSFEVKKERNSFEVRILKYNSPFETRNKFRTSSVDRSPESTIRKLKPLNIRTEVINLSSTKGKTFQDRKNGEEAIKRFESPPEINVKIIRTPLRHLV